MILGEKDFVRVAMANYSNQHCITIDEFESDLNRVSLIKKMITQYRKGTLIADRLLLNHLVLLFNVFGNSACVLLTIRIPREDWSILFTYLDAIDRTPETIAYIETSSIEREQPIVERLEEMLGNK